jgi:hypothetical protein
VYGSHSERRWRRPRGKNLFHPSNSGGHHVSQYREANQYLGRPAIYEIEVPEADVKALQTRVAATRWSDKETVANHSQGVQLGTVQELARYWAAGYDWRKCEAKLNALPQFMTEIDGLDIHFLHVRSKHRDALPLIVTHGWPGSVIEQLKIIDPLTTPPRTAPARRTLSTSWSRPCRATGSPPSPPRPAGARHGSLAPGRCLWSALDIHDLWLKAATGADLSPN